MFELGLYQLCYVPEKIAAWRLINPWPRPGTKELPFFGARAGINPGWGRSNYRLRSRMENVKESAQMRLFMQPRVGSLHKIRKESRPIEDPVMRGRTWLLLTP